VPDLLTLSDWRAAYRAGAAPRALLSRQLQALQPAPGATLDPAWITLASSEQLDAQCATLEDAERQHPDRATLLAALPLWGVPFAVKDNIDIAGVLTTAACPAFERLPGRTASAVQRLQRAGAVWLGKTNLDQFATGLVGTRSPYGQPACVFSAEHISGGSSSGSAVAVARGWVPFALATDTAGSGRVPAGFNHLVGLKPTPGRVSTTGVVPACRSLDCVSVFALTVDDAAQVQALIEGPNETTPAEPDAGDAFNTFALDNPAVVGPARWPGPLRLGVPKHPDFWGDAGYAASYERALAHARAQGHTVVPLDFTPLDRVAALLYDGPWVAERQIVVDHLLAHYPETLDPVVREVIGGARRFSAADAFRGGYELRVLARRAAALWNEVDALLVPTTTGHPRFAEVRADPIGVNTRLGRYTNFVNLLGWSALALPFDFTRAGLPFGVTFIAPGGHDAALVHLGRAWQGSLPPASQVLGGTGQTRPTSRQEPSDAPPQATPPLAAQATLALAVVGAHLSGLPLNGQLRERRAWLRETTTTAPRYALYALPNTTPPKPGLVRQLEGGHAIAVEVWEVPQTHLGSFLAMIPSPLGLGSLELADGRWVHGFTCEAHAVAPGSGAVDISHFGGWRAYLASLQTGRSP
jgi:allophanate hydrolase